MAKRDEKELNKDLFINICGIYIIVVSIIIGLITIFNHFFPCEINEGLGIYGCYNINNYYGLIKTLVQLFYNIKIVIGILYISLFIVFIIGLVIGLMRQSKSKIFGISGIILLILIIMRFVL